MINKKNIIKKYEQEDQNNHGSNDELVEKITKKAQTFNIPFFKNKTLRENLLDLDHIAELPGSDMREIADIFRSLIDTEKKAQISK